MNKPFDFIKKTILFVCITLCFSFLVGCNSVICDHIESNWIVDAEPSIYNEGSQHKECTKCGEVLSTESIPKLCNHIESNWIVDAKPSIYNEGSQHKECTKCGEVLSTESIPKLCNHIESNWIVDINATLQSEGAKHTECTKCGEIIQTQTIPELEYSLSEVKQLLSKSMVKVYCYDYDGETLLSQGSGFFIGHL